MNSSASPEVSSGLRSAILRRARRAGCGLVLAGMVAALAGAQNFGYRQLQGKVYAEHDHAINGAVVYLSNSRNSNIKTYISDTDGSYRFAGLSDDTDYTVWAAYEGKKSSKRTLSSFDQRKQVYFDLHIPVSLAGKSGS